MYDKNESDRTAAGAGRGEHEDADTVLASGTVRLRDGHGDSAGTGFLVGDGLVLTCAHVVCDALGKPRDTEVLAERPCQPRYADPRRAGSPGA